MFVFDDACIRNFTVGVIYHGISLIIVTFQTFFLKTYGTIFQRSVAESEIFIQHTGKYRLMGKIVGS